MNPVAVLDASVVLSWLLVDEAHPYAEALQDEVYGRLACVPAIWWFEVRSVIVARERSGRLSASQAQQCLDQVRMLDVMVMPVPNDEQAVHLARMHHVTVYDAAYVQLAVELNLPLATLDRDMQKAVVAAGGGFWSPGPR